MPILCKNEPPFGIVQSFFFVLKMAFPTGAGTKQGTFTSSNEAEEKHAGPGHLDVFVACYLLFASHNS